MRLALFCSFLLVLMGLSCRDTSRAPATVCDSWPVDQPKESSQKLNQAVDAFARTLDPKQPMRNNAQAIARWLEQQPCIQQAGVSSRVVETEPPVLDIEARHRNGTRRTFSVQFARSKVTLSYSY